MPSPAIRVSNLSKQYQIGATQSGYTTLRETIADVAKAPLRRLKALSGHPRADDWFWALKDVSFNIEPSEVVGVIGRNGAGKSTLLKILSQITEPTAGRIEIQGRMASLLEVGTGFHPELTGRENIFLNGAILGMRRAEIRRAFDDIVAFAEVDRFLDTPVKRYSSGMYVRLAFSVAAHLQPEILIVDEVLAVGDVDFQRKCLGKMHDVSRSGRTVLLVSHNLAAIRKLCDTAIVLDRGQLEYHGNVNEAIEVYLSPERRPAQAFSHPRSVESPDGTASIRDVSIHAMDDPKIAIGSSVVIEIVADFHIPMRNPAFVISLSTNDDVELFRCSTSPISGVFTGNCFGRVRATLTIDCLPMTGGRYHLSAGIAIPNASFVVPMTPFTTFDVAPTDYYDSGCPLTQERGLLALQHQWKVRTVCDGASVHEETQLR